jgi:hypothetical protein
MDMISGLNPGLRYPLPTLHERRHRHPCKARFRLAGYAFAERESNPLERDERFQVLGRVDGFNQHQPARKTDDG